jgi:PAT family beta-lactamase induction signal transducer AmpG
MAADASLAELEPSQSRSPWWWVPSLYFAQGVPYVVVMTVAVIMFKRLGVGNAQIALYTSWLYLPYAIKPLWSPLVQRIGTRRSWVLVMQLFVAAGLACAALSIPLQSFLLWSLVALAAVAICSATHDVAADGFYLLALSSHQQAWFVGIRSTAYRAAMIFGQGLLVMLAGVLESTTGLPVVEVEVRAVDRDTSQLEFDAAAHHAMEGINRSQQIKVVGKDHEISTHGRSAAETKAFVEQIRAWNAQHGFYPEAEKPTSQARDDDAATQPSWRVALEDFLRSRFGPNQAAVGQTSDRAGDVAAVTMRLTQPVPAGEQQVLQFGRAQGDASFQVVEGERFVLTDANWDKPFVAVVQVDPKLDRESKATFEVRSGNLRLAWSVTFAVIAAAFVLFCLYHCFTLPKPPADAAVTAASTGERLIGFIAPFVEFFRKPGIFATLAFLLLYRFPEAQLVKLATPFLLDTREAGGLGLTTGEVGFVYGTVGVIMLTLGGIIGGFVAARDGLRRWLWPMALAIHLPNLAFLFLAYVQPENTAVITAAVGVEQFGYGFGFTAYLLYCVYVARGQYETVHYALCTGFMALGMMIPGMWSGWLEELIGYQHFFVWIMLAMIPSLLAVALIRVDPQFGKKAEA